MCDIFWISTLVAGVHLYPMWILLSSQDIMGFTCLHLAAKLGHYDIVNHLISKTSKYINCQVKLMLTHSLTAALLESLWVLQLPFVQDDGGWTPITWAIEHKHKELVYLLLARGADVNIRDKVRAHNTLSYCSATRSFTLCEGVWSVITWDQFYY